MGAGYSRGLICAGILPLAVWGGRVEAAQASDFNPYGEVALRSRFVDDDLFVYSRGPVLQPNFGIDHEPSGCFVDIWANVGLQESVGDEIDYSVGCEREVAGGVTLGAYVSYFDFVGADDSMFAFTAEASSGEFRIQAQYYRPRVRSEADGFRVVGTYTRPLSRTINLEAKIAYDSGPYDGIRPILSGGGTLSFSLTDNLALSVTGLAPVLKHEGDSREPQVFASAVLRF